MKVVFRADASLQIGSGHVMRCLTLAEALRAEGADCYFICREHPGNLLDLIRSKGFDVHSLSLDTGPRQSDLLEQDTKQLAHAHWLGATLAQDAKASAEVLKTLRPDWLVVDHYALDADWEASLQACSGRLMVIDDLADRQHLCDVLLDQTLGRSAHDYSGLVPTSCQLLLGAQYALLRPEFSRLRQQSLERRGSAQLNHLLITMGGVDQANATGAALQALRACSLPAGCAISVVMGLKAPCLAEVIEIAAAMPWPTEVVVNVNDMAQRMVASDLIIGAAGSTSWERCCLGVPTIMVVLAENQKPSALALQLSGSVTLIEELSDLGVHLPEVIELLTNSDALLRMSKCARLVSDGMGVERVIEKMSVSYG
jgi:UDP-2,4-diacetamido-2,4,6-trideoxy-beta-L-altropyranose hydrolase